MKRDVFISYSRKDSSCVKRIKKEIESCTQVNCWMDLEAIVAGSRKFRKVIVDGINNSHVFLFMLSEHSQESDNAIGELELALRKSRETKGALKVVLVNIDNCRMNDEFYLSYCQMDIINWEDEEQKEKLLRDIKRWIPQLPPPPNDNRWVFLKKRAEVHISKIKERWKTFFKIIAPKINSTKRIIVPTLAGCTILVIGWIYIPQIVTKYYNNEARAWHAAKLENTVESYLSFLESQPIRHRDEAISRIIRYGNSESNLVGLLTLQQDLSLLNNIELMDSLAMSIIWWDKDVRKKMEHISRWFADDTKDYERLDGIEDTVMIIDSIVGLVQKHTQVIDTFEHKMNWVSKDVPYSIIQSWDTTFAPAMVALANYHTNTLQTLVKKGYEMVESHTAKESYLQRIRILERLCNQSAVGPKEKKSSIYEDGTKAVVEFFYYGFPQSQETLSRTSQ